MKVIFTHDRDIRRLRAMTLPELLVSMAVFLLLIGAFVTTHLFGLRQDELVNSGLGANDQARLNFNMILDEIRSSKTIQIGNGTYKNFVPITNGPQQGTSLQIIPSTDLSLLVYYWFDTNQNRLFRAGISNYIVNGVTNSSTVTTNVVAQYLTNRTSQWLTNSMMFRAMDYTGTNLLTTDPINMPQYNYNYTVAILFQFAQYQYPQTVVGSNSLYNYYQLTFSATRRNP
jgi:hypothetical protein